MGELSTGRKPWTPRSRSYGAPAAAAEDVLSADAFRLLITSPVGKEGTRAGKVNWAALARHLKFATPGTVHKQYNRCGAGLPPLACPDMPWPARGIEETALQRSMPTL